MLCCAVLCCAVMCYAVLCCTVLSFSNWQFIIHGGVDRLSRLPDDACRAYKLHK